MSTLAVEREFRPVSTTAPKGIAHPVRSRRAPVRPRRPIPQGRPPQDPHTLIRTLYADHASALRVYVTRLLADPYQAEDVVQETMLRAWRHAERLVPERGSVSGWLTRVAHNIAVDKIRARKARPEEVEEGAAVPRGLADHASDVVESVFVARALARLSPAHREVLRVVYFDDRTAVQAAETLGLPVGTVKSRTHHALRHLRVYLEEELAGDQ
jgi:RNA polymerase sigma-70 factor, ECF subfamily